MQVCFWEDETAEQFYPLALARPVFELVCGRYSVRERLQRAWDLTEWGAVIRPYLAAVYRESEPDTRLNDDQWLNQGGMLLLNGRGMEFSSTQEMLFRLLYAQTEDERTKAFERANHEKHLRLQHDRDAA
ncbi:putative sugar nucleotidyl transferase [Planctomycetaceae bacterium]|nr:putative sugar nucleotidyl transferase [bacterium]MDC0307767.1 putative sugar nucleotidyl transferase [Planctomycetaceae bacterium]